MEGFSFFVLRLLKFCCEKIHTASPAHPLSVRLLEMAGASNLAKEELGPVSQQAGHKITRY